MAAVTSDAPIPRASGYIAGPLYDWICFILAPLLAIGFVWIASRFAWPLGVVTGPGQQRTRVELFAAVWTYGHLFSVVFRSHFNGAIFQKHRMRFTLVPLALYGAFALSTPALVIGLFLIAIWDVYHSSMQNFGLGRIYDAKAGNDPAAHRQLDVWLNHVLYIGPILAGASLLPTLEGLRAFPAVGWEAPASALNWIGGHRTAIRSVVMFAGAAYVVYYVDTTLRMLKSGYRLPPQKVALLVSVGIGSIFAWGFLPPLEAFMISNLFHSLQYFGIVWVDGARQLGEHASPLERGRRALAHLRVLRAADRRCRLLSRKRATGFVALVAADTDGDLADALLVRRLRVVRAPQGSVSKRRFAARSEP